MRNTKIRNKDIEFFTIKRDIVLSNDLEQELDKRTIHLGELLYRYNDTFNCKELAFLPGSSGILDYV